MVSDSDQRPGRREPSAEYTMAVPRADLLGDAEPAQPIEDAASPTPGLDEVAPGAAALVITRGPNAGQRFLLARPVTTAGRHPDSDVVLDDATVSRAHAEFRHEHDRFLVVDLGSLNGTYVNRQPIDSAALDDGDQVQIGKFRLLFQVGPPTD